MSLKKDHVAGEKPPNPRTGDWWEENRTRDQSMKNLPTDEGDGEENRKIINIVDEKTFQLGLRTGKEKPRLVERGETWFSWWGTWMIRDLDDKGLGQNKVLCSSSRVELPWSTTMQAPQHSLRQGDRSPASYRLLALELHWLRFLFVASSLSSLLCRLFFVASLSALFSASCQSPLFPLRKELDCWPGHGRSEV